MCIFDSYYVVMVVVLDLIQKILWENRNIDDGKYITFPLYNMFRVALVPREHLGFEGLKVQKG